MPESEYPASDTTVVSHSAPGAGGTLSEMIVWDNNPLQAFCKLQVYATFVCSFV